ncbi:hypothetical protein B566_EDAN011833 [Ephemera danica]|nr:hypothetical protein B566_EDAN011833 [Ephemera danica]
MAKSRTELDQIPELQTKSVIGGVHGGLVAHPDGRHIVYPMGAKLVVQNWVSGEQSLLEGHTSNISVLAVSPCGNFLASGQILQPPFHKVDGDDTFMYCGTTTGDVVKIRLNLLPSPAKPVLVSCLAKPPTKKKEEPLVLSPFNGNYANGVRAIVRIDHQHLVIGAGDGTIDLVEEIKIPEAKMKKQQAGQKTPTLAAFKVKRNYKLEAVITSVTKFGEKRLLVGTQSCDIFSLPVDDFSKIELHVTCHPSPVYSLAFPIDTSEVFISSGDGDFRIWRTTKSKNYVEIHRIMRTGLACRSVLVTQDGTAIFSAWDDGTIRAYAPNTGRILTEILGAHRSCVSSLGITSQGNRLVSGGREGQVRVWDCKGSTWQLNCVFAEQRGTIAQVAIKENDEEAASACEDGTCYIWGIKAGEDISCKQCLKVGGKLSATCFLPGSDPLLLTAGADRRVVCWDTDQGVALRNLEMHAAITSLNILHGGLFFITGFEDGIIKVNKIILNI